MVFIMASMCWTCFSYTRSAMLGGGTEEARNSGGNNINVSLMDEENPKPLAPVKGVVTGGGGEKEYGTTGGGESERDIQAKATGDTVSDDTDTTNGQAWKLNLVLVLLSCWYAMVLTSWGTITNNGSPANPSAGETSMWMMMTAQWIALALYSWSLVAPRLFPDRDFT